MLTKLTYLIPFMFFFGSSLHILPESGLESKCVDPHQRNLFTFFNLPFNHMFRDAMSETTKSMFIRV